MEELLNKLIEKGWKPRWNQPEESLKKKIKVERCNRKPVAIVIKRPRRFIDEYYSFRELFSKESWLWQFVCENRMTKKMEKNPRGIWINSWAKSAYEKYPVYTMEKFEYRLIESVLCDEDKLEDFILSNIKVDGNI